MVPIPTTFSSTKYLCLRPKAKSIDLIMMDLPLPLGPRMTFRLFLSKLASNYLKGPMFSSINASIWKGKKYASPYRENPCPICDKNCWRISWIVFKVYSILFVIWTSFWLSHTFPCEPNWFNPRFTRAGACVEFHWLWLFGAWYLKLLISLF